ncbi:MAG: hypothetical protein QME62_03105 [Armatimonadota bacterium]|nr:hypothetical protein [Armatimonadota bacterium]
MDGFYNLICLLISLAGFVIVTGVLLIRNETLLVASVKGVVAFLVLKVVLGMLGKLFNAVSFPENSERGDTDKV